MSEKNKRKIEKKLIALIALVIMFGIAVVVPLTLFMNNDTKAQDSWFDMRLNAAYFSANADDKAATYDFAFEFEPLVNFDTYNRQTGARIEYFEVAFYTDDLQILEKKYFVIGANSSYIENPEDFITFSREEWVNSGGFDQRPNYFYDLPTLFSELGDTLGTVSTQGTQAALTDELSSARMAAIDNKQTIYLDITRVGYTTFDGDNTSVVFTSKVVIQHVELTKNDNAFTFGDQKVIEHWIYLIENGNRKIG